ncbi:MAG: glycosyltransferase family 39 protein, partial [Patescibacteria group bacterium]
MKKTTVLLFIIFILGSFLRFYTLGEVPVGLHRDEAFLGYNAYSLLKTGKDMNGIALPLHLKSFLYSPAGYSYASIPFIAAFGLNAFSVRFASALFGTLTILLTYFLVRELFKSSRLTSYISLLTSLLLAVSPWHLNLSRTATENTLAVFFITLGTLLYLLWHRNQRFIMLLASFVSFAISLFIYQAPRAFL